MKYFGIFDKNVATIFILQWKIGNISNMFLQYWLLCGIIIGVEPLSHLLIILIIFYSQHLRTLRAYYNEISKSTDFGKCIDFHVSYSFVKFLNLDLIGSVTWYPTPTRTIIIHNFTNTEHIQFVIQPLYGFILAIINDYWLFI